MKSYSISTYFWASIFRWRSTSSATPPIFHQSSWVSPISTQNICIVSVRCSWIKPNSISSNLRAVVVGRIRYASLPSTFNSSSQTAAISILCISVVSPFNASLDPVSSNRPIYFNVIRRRVNYSQCSVSWPTAVIPRPTAPYRDLNKNISFFSRLVRDKF